MPPATFPTVLGDFGCDVTCHTCRENSPRTHAITLGSNPPLVTRIARTGLGKRLGCPIFLTKYLDVSLCVRPDVMKRYVMGHFLFPGNIDFASMTESVWKNNNNDINNPSLRENGFFLCVQVRRRILHFIFKLLKTSQLTKC